ncbi:hypothetical protein ABH944_007791 [Caballeronia udeis]|uniref:Uncharacterized protein n=1 Tax=Caballeronia udeis TaxID=1232866 RepID=A0ABW8MUS6_9BURK
MRKLFVSLLALIPIACFGITYTPLPLISSAGSTSGQVIASTGPSSAPAWTTVTLSGLGGLAATNNLSDLMNASTARTNLGLGTGAVVNTGTSGAVIPLLSTANTWALAQTFTVRPTFNGNTPYDTGNLTIGNYLTTASATSTYATIAQATTALAATGGSINGVTVGQATPLAGSFTTLSATSTVTIPSGTTFNQPNIVGGTSGTAAPSGAIGQWLTVTGTSIAVTTSGITQSAISYSLPAGDYDVQSVITVAPAGTTNVSFAYAGVGTSATSLGALGAYVQTPWSATAGQGGTIASPVSQILISATTTIYATTNVSFGTSTCNVTGYLRFRRLH